MRLPRLCSRPSRAFYKFVLPSGVLLFIIKFSIYANFKKVSKSENSLLILDNSTRSGTVPKLDKLDNDFKTPNSFSVQENSESVYKLPLSYPDLNNGSETARTVSVPASEIDRLDSAPKTPISFSVQENSASVFKLSLSYPDRNNGNAPQTFATTLSMRASEQMAGVEMPQSAEEHTVDIEKESHTEQTTEKAKETMNTEKKAQANTQENKEEKAQDNVQENTAKQESTQESNQEKETNVKAQEIPQGNKENTENVQDNVQEKTENAQYNDQENAQDNFQGKSEKEQYKDQENVQNNLQDKTEKAQDNVQENVQNNLQKKTEKAQYNVQEKTEKEQFNDQEEAEKAKEKVQHSVHEKAQDNVQKKTEKAQDNVHGKLKEEKKENKDSGPKWKCSVDGADLEIGLVCDLYKRGVITGSLCPALCHRKQLVLNGCDRVSWQKKVMRVNCTDACREGLTVPAILKTQIIDVTHTIKDLRVESAEPSLNDTQQLNQRLQDFIVLTVKNNLGFLPFSDSRAVEVMWGHVQGQGHDLQQENAAVWRSVSLLVAQQEYLFAKSLQDAHVFPEIYGSCGHYFVQEFCSPPTRWSEKHSTHSTSLESPWAERAEGALKLLQFHQDLDRSLPDRLFNCDLKLANFGLCENGALKMIDSNNVYFNASMTYHLRSHLTPPCKTDDQCVYFTEFCGGKCDVKTGACYMPYDVNLEFTCRNVFMVLADITNRKTSFDGIGNILRHPPVSVQPELSRVLSDCESLITLHQPGAQKRVMDELANILRRSLQFNT